MDAISDLVERIFTAGRDAAQDDWHRRSIEDYLANFDQDVANLIEKAYLAGAAWAASRNEGWAEPHHAAEAFKAWRFRKD